MFKSVFWTALYTTPLMYFGLQTFIAETRASFLVGPGLAVLVAAGIFAVVFYHDALYKHVRLRWAITTLVGGFGLWGIVSSMIRHSDTLLQHLIISVSVVGIVIVIAVLISYGEVVSELYRQFLRARGKIPQRSRRVYDFLTVSLPISRRILFLRFFAYGLVLATVISVIVLLPGNEFLHVKLIVWGGVFSALVILDGILTVEILRKGIVEQELQTARQMQVSLMPASDPAIKGFDISGVCKPASDVGGDYFDYVWLDKKRTRLGIALADVSGKAMRAAFTAALTSGILYSELDGNRSVRQVLARMNRPMYLRTDKRVFTAFFLASLDVNSKKLTFTSAGQTKPILKRGEKLVELETKGPRLPLGVQEKISYQETRFALKRGDVVLFYTDGFLRQTNRRDEQFGVDRLRATLQSMRLRSMTAKEIIADLLDNVASFRGRSQQSDDMTMVVVKVR
ncbi:MAG: PP2C family protein-serine/threonine phosphatase [Bacteroidota bacterium]